jgi:hypothetical protein
MDKATLTIAQATLTMDKATLTMNTATLTIGGYSDNLIFCLCKAILDNLISSPCLQDCSVCPRGYSDNQETEYFVYVHKATLTIKTQNILPMSTRLL